MFVNRPDDAVRVHSRVTHRERKQLPVGLGNGKEQMRAREQRVFAPARILDRTIHHPSGGLGQSAHRNLEFVDVHRTLQIIEYHHARHRPRE